MAYEGFLRLAGEEIVNQSRTVAYAQAGLRGPTLTVESCGVCPDLADLLDCGAYSCPADEGNQASWFDPLEPDSALFAGLMVTEITGLDASPIERSVTALLGDGSALGPVRYGPRTIQVSGVLLGATCCSIDYGLRWLQATLRGSRGCSGCTGDTLEFLSCCPTSSEAPCRIPTCASLDPVDPGGCEHPSAPNPDELTPYWRTLYNVGAVGGVEVTEKLGPSCGSCNGCAYVAVTFTLVAGNPAAYRDPVCHVCEETLADGTRTDCLEVVLDTNGDGCAGRCSGGAQCPNNPRCPRPEAAPRPPIVTNPCYCEPVFARRKCFPIPASASRSWFDSVPIITVESGSSELRSLKFSFYRNDRGLPEDDVDDECLACATITVGQVPANSTLRIDGRTKQVTIECPGLPPRPATRDVSGPGGGPFVWPTLECGVDSVVCIQADEDFVAADATVTVCTAIREL